MEAVVTPIDDLWWTATKYSDVLKVDRRVCQQALETVPYKMIGKRQVWHVRDAFDAIYRRKYGMEGSGDAINPAKLPPKDRLDHYKAERERIKLDLEERTVINTAEVMTVFGEAFKLSAQEVGGIPDALENECGLSLEQKSTAQRIVDQARDRIYDALMKMGNS